MNSVAPSRAGQGRASRRVQLGGQPKRTSAPRKLGTAGRGRSVGSSSTGGRPGELPAPVGELRVAGCRSPARRAAALPDREVGVLHRQLGSAARRPSQTRR